MIDLSSMRKEEVFGAFFGEFTRFKPVQEKTIPILLDGRNIIVSAGTGTGKTEAVLAPLVSRYLDYALSNDCLTWLYITPTKALVNDIYRRIEPVLSRLHIKVGIRHGDRDDTYKSKSQHLLITTPESLDVMLSRGDKMLQSVRAVVLDETHMLYNTQRGLQMSLLISRLKSEVTNPFLQLACLSATIASGTNLATFLFGDSENFGLVSIPSPRTIDATIRMVESEREFIELIEKIIRVGPAKLLVFANSRKQCDRLSALLSQSESLASCVFTHYSSLSAQLREEAEKTFNESQTAICIATSTLELGIDIGDIDAIILYDSPSTVSSFLQRIGRGNRRTNKTNAICLIPLGTKQPILDALTFYAIIELACEGIIEKTGPMKLFGAMAQQAISIIATNKGAYTRVRDIASVALNQHHLTEEVIDEILTSASAAGLVQPHGFKHRYGADEGLYSLLDYRLIYGNMPMRSQEVVIKHGKKEIGHVPAVNLLKIECGEVIRFAGRCWQVVKADRDGIQVEPSHHTENAMNIRYGSKGLNATDILILNRMYEYLTGRSVNTSLFGKNIQHHISQALRVSSKVFANNIVPTIRIKDDLYHITFAGYTCNRVLGKSIGISEPKVDAIGIFAPWIIDFSLLDSNLNAYESIVNGLFSTSPSQTIFQSVLPESMQRKEFVEEWLCNPETEKVLKRLRKSVAKEVSIESVSWLISHQ